MRRAVSSSDPAPSGGVETSEIPRLNHVALVLLVVVNADFGRVVRPDRRAFDLPEELLGIGLRIGCGRDLREQGEALLDPAVTKRLVSEFARLRPKLPPRPEALDDLTPRETEVLRLVAEGLSNGEIAERLVVSDETVKTHVSRVLTKLGLRDRTQAVVVAYESGLVVPRVREDAASG